MRFLQQANVKILLLLMGVIFALQACIKDDYGECFQNEVVISFIYDINEPQLDKFEEVVDHVDLYIYNEKNSALVAKYTATKAELSANSCKYSVVLRPGTYRVVAWMNLSIDYPASEDKNLLKARITTNTTTGIEVHNGMENIFHGAESVLVPESKATIACLIPFVKDTKQITVDANILDGTLPATQVIETKVSGTHGVYDYYNNCVLAPEREYRPDYSLIPGVGPRIRQTFVSLYSTVQKMWSSDDLVIEVFLKETGKPDELLARHMLTHLIMANPKYSPDSELDRYDKIKVTFNYEVDPIDGTLMVGEVLVDDYLVIDTEIEL